MKNFVIGLFIIGLTSLGFSQDKNGVVEEVKLKNVIITADNVDVPLINTNFSYLDKVQDIATPEYVKFFETEASMYNVLKSRKFDGRKEPFEIIFKGTKGYIIATYDNQGKILTTKERYTNIVLPRNMKISIMLQYPNCRFLKMLHIVNYNHQKNVEKIFKVQIRKDNLIQNLKIIVDSDANNAFTMSLDN